MAKHIARLQEQLEAANGSVTELTEDLEKANSRADKTHKDSLLAMEQVMVFGFFFKFMVGILSEDNWVRLLN